MSGAEAMTGGAAAFPKSEKRGLIRAFQTQKRVFHALMLHDIKARFFGSGIGYIITILWPSGHLAIIVGAFILAGRVAPYGDDRLLYACTGVLPWVIWNYISRFTMLGVVSNKSFLQYPLVKPLDLMLARQALEVVSCTIITAGMIIFLYSVGSDPMPHHPQEAFFALMSAVLLGSGFGIVNATICMIFPIWNIIYIAIIVFFWITCGTAINPEAMPTQIGDILAWIPLLHSVEWIRVAYYDDFPARLLDRSYVLYWGLGSLAVGLIMERGLRLFTTR